MLKNETDSSTVCDATVKTIKDLSLAQNRDYNRRLTPVGTFDVFVPTAPSS